MSSHSISKTLNAAAERIVCIRIQVQIQSALQSGYSQMQTQAF